jgi:predicted metal-dependent hydrolase
MNPYLQDILHNITTRLAKLEEAPPSLLDSVHCQCGASWKYKDGELDYKPSIKKKEWVGLTDDEINYSVDAIYKGFDMKPRNEIEIEYFERVIKFVEAKLKEKNDR